MLRAAVGLDDVEPIAEHHEPDGAVLVDEEPNDGGGDGDGGLDGRVVAVADVVLAGEVEDHPEVGGWVEFEGFDLQRAGAQGTFPVDAVDRVAGLVVADARGVWGDVMCASAEASLAGQVGGRRGVARQLERAWIDDESAPMPEAQLAVEDVERVGAAHGDWSEVVEAAPVADGLYAPVAVAGASEGGDESGAVAGQVGGFFDFEPELGDGGAVDHFEALDDRFSGLDAVARAGHADAHALSRGPGPGPGEDDAEEQGVAEALGQPVVGREADGEGDDRESDDDAERAAGAEGRAPRAAEG